MVALNYTMFVDKVIAGTKRQTIRAETKAHTGCMLQHYEGQRTKKCRKLRPDDVCLSVINVVLMEKVAQPAGNTAFVGKVHLDEFAKNDGFDTYEDMWAFFKARANEHGEFHGKLIKW